MTIHDLIEQFTIQGGYCVKQWSEEHNDCMVLEEGRDFECEWYNFSEAVMNGKISYMYAVDGVLNIELDW